MFLFLTVVQALIAAALVGVVLMQRSEGGGLGIGGGGSPADFLTRTTKWLAVLFVVLAIVIGGVAVNTTSGGEIDTSLERTVAPAPDPLAPAAQPGGLDAPVVETTPAPAESPSPQGTDPLADVAQ